jgi:adenylosuccinate synthase
VVGLQWGDEAKGKVVDLLTEQFDIVVRYQGGANAGHTVVTEGQTFKLSHIPSGIFRPTVRCVVAAGVVVHPATLLAEIDGLRQRGITVGSNLMLSDRAHVIFPWHIEEDRFIERQCAAGEAIGTTLRGIGPCYRDKVGRSWAVRLGDMYHDDFRQRVAHIAQAKNQMLQALGGDGQPPLDAESIFQEYAGYAARLRPYVADTTAYLLDAAESGKRILFEGAQGTLLDIDHGTFPYVTSSNSSAAGVAAGAGVPARCISKIIGVAKAYTTRVGGGPFPTEQANEIGQRIRDRGTEYGTVTRRPRRCGWFDAVAVRYTARLNGVDALAVMLLDVLSGLPELQVCVAYELDGRRMADFPSHVDDLRRARPVYETLPGWQEEISGARHWHELPENARRYLAHLSRVVGRPIEWVSVGPDRQQTIRAVSPEP